MPFHPALLPPLAVLAHRNDKSVGHDRSRLLHDLVCVGEVVHGIPGIAGRAHYSAKNTGLLPAEEACQLGAKFRHWSGRRCSDMDDSLGAEQLVVRDLGRGGAHATQESDRFGRMPRHGRKLTFEAEPIRESRHIDASGGGARICRYPQAHVGTVARGFARTDALAYMSTSWAQNRERSQMCLMHRFSRLHSLG